MIARCGSGGLGSLNLNVLLVDDLLNAHVFHDDVLFVNHGGSHYPLLCDFHVVSRSGDQFGWLV